MDHEEEERILDEQIIVSRKALVEAFLELERQQAREMFQLFDCMKQMEQAYLDLHRLVEGCFSIAPRVAIEKLLFPRKGDFTVSDELFYQWQAEFEAQLRQEKAQDEREGLTLLLHQCSPSPPAE